MALTLDVVSGPEGRVERVWAAACGAPTEFTSIASACPGIAFTRIGGVMTVTVRGPETRATTMPCPPDAEFFGVELRIGAYLPMLPPGLLSDLRDVDLPVRPNGRFRLDGTDWEMPTPDNVGVFVTRLERAGLLVFDPLVEEIHHDATHGVPARTAQHRYRRAVGLPRRKVVAIDRARHAARLLRAGVPVATVVDRTSYYDQPHLTRALRGLVGYTPGQLARGDTLFLDL